MKLLLIDQSYNKIASALAMLRVCN